MQLFKATQNTPDNYVDNSRDFQLFCNILDAITNGMLMDAENIHNANNPNYCYSSMLPLLSQKVGIFNLDNSPSYLLRPIIRSFVKLRQAKGTKVCLYNLMNLYMKATNNPSSYQIEIINDSEDTPYCIKITIQGQFFDTSLLDKLLYYLKPTGYVVNWIFTPGLNPIPTDIIISNSLDGYIVSNDLNDLLRSNNPSDGYDENLITRAVDTMNLPLKGSI